MVVYKKAQYEYNILGASKTGWNFAGAKATVYERLDGNEWKNGRVFCAPLSDSGRNERRAFGRGGGRAGF